MAWTLCITASSALIIAVALNTLASYHLPQTSHLLFLPQSHGTPGTYTAGQFCSSHIAESTQAIVILTGSIYLKTPACGAVVSGETGSILCTCAFHHCMNGKRCNVPASTAVFTFVAKHPCASTRDSTLSSSSICHLTCVLQVFI